MPKATQDIIILGPSTEAFGISSILITHQYLGGWLNKEEIDIHVCHRIIPIQAKTSLQKAEQPCDSIWSAQDWPIIPIAFGADLANLSC
jgi:hypothetical protein